MTVLVVGCCDLQFHTNVMNQDEVELYKAEGPRSEECTWPSSNPFRSLRWMDGCVHTIGGYTTGILMVCSQKMHRIRIYVTYALYSLSRVTVNSMQIP